MCGVRPRIRNGADGTEGVISPDVDLGAAIALEGGVAPLLTGVAGVIVDPVGVTLPDFDHGAGHHRAVLVEDPARDVRDTAYGLRLLPADAYEVSIHVRGEGDGIERPFGLAWRDDERAGSTRGRNARQCQGGADADNEIAAREDFGGHGGARFHAV
jgi:hypothetical protein